MRRRLLMTAVMLTALLAANLGSEANAGQRHRTRFHGRYGAVHYGVRVGYGHGFARYSYPPLAGTVGTPIPPYAARFMGYPYNVRGYRYEYADGCLLRVGGLYGPGPSISPCPFGADKAY